MTVNFVSCESKCSPQTKPWRLRNNSVFGIKECKPFSVRPFSPELETSIFFTKPHKFLLMSFLRVWWFIKSMRPDCLELTGMFSWFECVFRKYEITRPNEHDMPPRRAKAAPHYTSYSRHPFLWLPKPGTPIAKPDISLVTSYHLRSVGIRMSLRKNKNG